MEEQVELARAISHSLSADTNSTSRGQSMYVKRRNRSSKWVHQGIGKAGQTSHTIAKPIITPGGGEGTSPHSPTQSVYIYNTQDVHVRYK